MNTRHHPLPDLSRLLGRECVLVSNVSGHYWWRLRLGDIELALPFAVKVRPEAKGEWKYANKKQSLLCRLFKRGVK